MITIKMQDNKDIQPQAEPYIVKSHYIDADYADWIADIKSRYLFYAENMKKLKRLVSVFGAEKMHHWCRIGNFKTPPSCWRIAVRC